MLLAPIVNPNYRTSRVRLPECGDKKVSHSSPRQVQEWDATNKTNNKAICHRRPLYMVT